jgi:hypothetical protein
MENFSTILNYFNNYINTTLNNMVSINQIEEENEIYTLENILAENNTNNATNNTTNINSFSNILLQHLTDLFSNPINRQQTNTTTQPINNETEQRNIIATRVVTITPSGTYAYTTQSTNLEHVMTEEMENILNILFSNFRHNEPTDVVLPLTTDAINQLEEKKYSAINIDNKAVECSICQENYEESSDVIILPCKHLFHKECITQWLRNYHHKCPLCRQPCGEHTAITE